jgi:hypothetical protein
MTALSSRTDEIGPRSRCAEFAMIIKPNIGRLPPIDRIRSWMTGFRDEASARHRARDEMPRDAALMPGNVAGSCVNGRRQES